MWRARGADRRAHGRRRFLRTAPDLVRVELHRPLQPVERPGVLQHRAVPPPPHVVDDSGHPGDDAGVGLPLPLDDRPHRACLRRRDDLHRTISVQRVLDDPMAPGRPQPRHELPDGPLLEHGRHRHPVGVAQRRDGRALERRQQREDRVEVGALHVQHQADPALRFDRRLQQQGDVLDLRPLRLVVEGAPVGDEPRVRLEHRVDDAQVVGAQRRPGLGRFDDRVGQVGRLHLGGAPRELDVDVDAEPPEVRLGHAHQLSGNPPAFQVPRRLVRRILRHRQHPAHLAVALLRVDEIADVHHLVPRGRTVLRDPVDAGQPRVDRLVGDVAGHLLRADQRARDLRVVDSWGSRSGSSRRC